jgi:hypothetical protein
VRWVIALCLLVRIAHAEDKPWTVGVTDAQKAEANKFLDEGNARFLDKNYPAALESYRKAIAAWDHPAIRFNIVRCLVLLDRPVEAFDNLELALKYGNAPLEESVYTEALAYQTLLAKQIADVTISCKQPGVAVVLDGQALPACPTEQTKRVGIGHHSIVGTRDGFVPMTKDVVVAGGDKQRIAIELAPVAGPARYGHRWPTWKPWAVFAGGLVLAGVGGVFEVRAFSEMRDYDNLVASVCPGGCAPDALPSSRDKDRARRDSAIGLSLIATGAVAATIGGIMLYMNRETAQPVGVSATDGGASVFVTGRF